MLPDAMEMKKTEIPYAIVKLDLLPRVIKQAINELPSLRKRLEKYKDDKPKAREVYSDLQHQYGRLLVALNSAALPLLEMELSEMETIPPDSANPERI